jgi:hypothetical protein
VTIRQIIAEWRREAIVLDRCADLARDDGHSVAFHGYGREASNLRYRADQIAVALGDFEPPPRGLSSFLEHVEEAL